jgi:hypothetical protein
MKDSLANYQSIDLNIAFYQSRIDSYRPLMGLTRNLHRLAITQMTHYQSKIVELKTRKKDIEQAVKNMPSPYREAIQCRSIEGLSINATARKLHYAPTTIRRHIERGIQILEGWQGILRDKWSAEKGATAERVATEKVAPKQRRRKHDTNHRTFFLIESYFRTSSLQPSFLNLITIRYQAILRL